MSDFFWLSDVQMARLKPYFPKSRGKPRSDDRRVLRGCTNLRRMLTRRTMLSACLAAAMPHWAQASDIVPLDEFTFPSIDGGDIALSDWRGQAILVVNTASECGFTPQYDGLQALSDRYGSQGLRVLTIPSDDFRQELSSAAAVKEFCEINFGLDLPMTDILNVRGRRAHPFFAYLKRDYGFEPKWNFNKVLIGANGRLAGTYPSSVEPMSRRLRRDIEAAL